MHMHGGRAIHMSALRPADAPGAIGARNAMHGRKFGGRVVEAVLMGEHDYKEVRAGRVALVRAGRQSLCSAVKGVGSTPEVHVVCGYLLSCAWDRGGREAAGCCERAAACLPRWCQPPLVCLLLALLLRVHGITLKPPLH